MKQALMVTLAIFLFVTLTAGTIYHGRDKGYVQNSGGQHRGVVCDREPDGIRADGYVRWGDGGESYFDDSDGWGGSCGHSRWRSKRVAAHGVGEGCPYFFCNTHRH